MIGHSPAMQQIFVEMMRANEADAALLITGEAGTGKAALARMAHQLSGRQHKPFIAMQLATTPKALMESALFGHADTTRPSPMQHGLGAFQRAAGGTLFLSDITTLPLKLQALLLHQLQAQQASDAPQRVRLIAATTQDVAARVQSGHFLEALMAHLQPHRLAVPPLRARTEDIEPLVAHFMQTAEAKGLRARVVEPAAFAALREHRWPGNVRALEQLVHKLCMLGHSTPVYAAEIQALLKDMQMEASPSNVVALKPSGKPVAEKPAALEALVEDCLREYFSTLGTQLPTPGLHARVLEQLERPLLTHALRATGGNQIRAAEMLGINRNTLRKKIRLLGIDQKRTRKHAA